MANANDSATALKLDIITPDGIVFRGDVESLRAPGAEGSFGVLVNHAPFMTTIGIGIVEVTEKNAQGKSRLFATSGGYFEVLHNSVSLLAETCEPAEKIDIERAQAAMKRAHERLKSPRPEIDIVRAQTALHRALNRIKVAQAYQSISRSA